MSATYSSEISYPLVLSESPSSNSKSGVTDGAGEPGGDGITTRPEGLSMGSAPSAPKTGAESALPYVDSTIAQGAKNVNLGGMIELVVNCLLGKIIPLRRAPDMRPPIWVVQVPLWAFQPRRRILRVRVPAMRTSTSFFPKGCNSPRRWLMISSQEIVYHRQR